MAKCPSCGKMCSLNFEDPELEDGPAIDGLTVTATVRIARTSECCGDEVKEATFELETDVDAEVIEPHLGEDGDPRDGHDLSVEEDGVDQVEEGGGRYQKSYFGASLSFKVRCSCQGEPVFEGTVSDKVAASGMDELS